MDTYKRPSVSSASSDESEESPQEPAKPSRKTASKLSLSISSRSKTIDEIVVGIVHGKLELPSIDCGDYIATLKTHLIYTQAHLVKVPLPALPRLKLPILLELELASIIEQHKLTTGTDSRDVSPRPTPLFAQRSFLSSGSFNSRSNLATARSPRPIPLFTSAPLEASRRALHRLRSLSSLAVEPGSSTSRTIPSVATDEDYEDAKAALASPAGKAPPASWPLATSHPSDSTPDSHNSALLVAGSLTRSEDTNDNSTPRMGRKSRVDSLTNSEAKSPKGRRAKSLTRASSMIMRLSKDERDVMQDQCEFVLALHLQTPPEPAFAQLSTVFYETVTEMDGNLVRVVTSVAVATILLVESLQFIELTLRDPFTAASKMAAIATQHLIYGIGEGGFRTFGLALTYALEVVLGTDVMTTTLKDCWFRLATQMGNRIAGLCEEVSLGLSGQLFTKTGKEWKKFSTLLLPDALILFHDVEKLQVKEEIDMAVIESIGNAEALGEKQTLPRVTPFAFFCIVDGLRRFFFVETRSELDWWIEQLRVRVQAYGVRKRQADDRRHQAHQRQFHSPGSPRGLPPNPAARMSVGAPPHLPNSPPVSRHTSVQTLVVAGTTGAGTATPPQARKHISPRPSSNSLKRETSKERDKDKEKEKEKDKDRDSKDGWQDNKISVPSVPRSKSALQTSASTTYQWEDVLRDPNVFNEFKKFLSSRYNSEHLLFWKAALEYEETYHNKTFSDAMKLRADKIYRKYITGDLHEGKYMISISPMISLQLRKAVEAGQVTSEIFVQASGDVEHSVLRQYFLDFLKSR